eukprot:TRINITY_DN10494_c0_g2_i1.p1 TRINITY_DN10494_c0_g2~~TRINITY_DN10494_c0_g2_i1.p1  ORF type:complete len:340 (+),score=81.94 TRINITY_DN10494_c0_g2_i1:98-1021(+)
MAAGGGGGTGLQVFVRIDGGDSVPVDVDPGASVADLLAALPQEVSQRSLQLSYAGHPLGKDALLADEGVGQEAVVDASTCTGHAPMSWGVHPDDWVLLEGHRARRTTSTAGWHGATILTSNCFTEGRHVWALELFIMQPGSTNFTVGVARPDVPLNDQMYPSDLAWSCIDHGDAYARGSSHSPRNPFKSGMAIVFCLDLTKEEGSCRLSIWSGRKEEPDGAAQVEVQADQEAAQDDSDSTKIVEFSDIAAPVHGAVCTLAKDDSDEPGYGADIIRVPSWATADSFLSAKVGWELGAGPPVMFYQGAP